MVLGAVDPSILVALIGAPAALVIAMGTVWSARRHQNKEEDGRYRYNGHRYITAAELRDILTDMRREQRHDADELKSTLLSKIDASVDTVTKLLNLHITQHRAER